MKHAVWLKKLLPIYNDAICMNVDDEIYMVRCHPDRVLVLAQLLALPSSTPPESLAFYKLSRLIFAVAR